MKEQKDKKAIEATTVPLNTGDIAVDEGNDNGSIQISNTVIATIVKKFTLEVEGVTRFAPQGIVGDIAGLLNKRNYDRNIEIELGEGEATITLTLVMLFGVNIVEVAQNIQNLLIEKIQSMTGITVKKVNVIVKELEEPKPVEEETADEESEEEEATEGELAE